MPLDRITDVLRDHVANLEEMGTAKGAEKVVTGAFPPPETEAPASTWKGRARRSSSA